MSNYQSDLVVAKYVLMLKTLKRSFDKFEIFYKRGDVNIDTVNKLINANKIDFNIKKDDVKNIKLIIKEIRDDIVE